MARVKKDDSNIAEIKPSGILTKFEIDKYKLIKNSNMEPINKDHIQVTTYDLKVGEAHFLYNEGKWEKIYIGKNVDRYNDFKNNNGFKRQHEVNYNLLEIAPYSSAIIQLDEIIDTYSECEKENKLIVGRFDLKLQEVSQGLISQQATQVEPFYKGRLFCYIYNFSNDKRVLEFEQAFATIEFMYVSNSDETNNYLIEELKEKNKEKYGNKEYCSGEGINDIRYLHHNGKIPKGLGLLSFLQNDVNNYINTKADEVKNNIYKEINKFKEEVKEKINFRDKLIIAIITIIISVFIAIFTLIFQISNQISNEKSSEKSNASKTESSHETVNNELKLIEIDDRMEGEIIE